MNHTTNYNLSQWSKSDQVLMEDFNADNAKIDAALAQKAEASALAALAQTVEGKARIAVGSYTGDGAESRFISVGFTPRAVLLMTAYGNAGSGSGVGIHTSGGLAVTGSPLIFNSGGQIHNAAEIADGGFNVTYIYINSDYTVSTNAARTVYNYLAIG